MRVLEKDIQKILAKELINKRNGTVKREVKTEVGVIDIIAYLNTKLINGVVTSKKVLIEVKEVSSIKHAIGQVISYKRYHSDCAGYVVVYFTRDTNDLIHSYSKARKYEDTAREHGIILKNIIDLVNIKDIEEICEWRQTEKRAKQNSAVSPVETSLEFYENWNQLPQRITEQDSMSRERRREEAYLPEPERLTGVRLGDIMW